MTDRTVLVTGAAGGMSAGITQRLGQAGHHVICVDLDAAGAEAAADAVARAGGHAGHVACDLRDESQVRDLARRVARDHGVTSCIVNAAGVLDRRPIAEIDDESFERVMSVNVSAAVRVTRAFLPGMIEQGWGRIVNITSIAASHGYPYASYAASKAALKHFGMALVSDLRGTGVTVNSVSPGIVDTPMVIDSVRDRVAQKVPTGSLISPEEIGDLVVFLVSDSARNITGADIVIDGGATQLLAFFDR